MAFRSSDGLPILLRKLPDRCKTRPSKLLRNSSSRPFVLKFGRWVKSLLMYLKPKMYRGSRSFCKRFWQNGDVSLPNVTTKLYIFFQIFCRWYLRLWNTHLVWYSIYEPGTCVISATEPWGSGVLALSTREQELSSRSATRTYLNFTTPAVYYHQNNTCTMCI